MKNLFLILIAFTFASCATKDPQTATLHSIDIQLIRNATLKINYANESILVDPMLSPKNSFMSFVTPNQNLNPTVDLPLSIQDITNDIGFVLLTHSHPDHFDQTAINTLDKKIPFFVQPNDKAVVEQANFTNVKSIDNSTKVGQITITRTDGKHGPDSLLHILDHVSGYVLQAENYPTVYLVGDCIWDTQVERNIEQYNPDIIVTNSGGAIFMGNQQILMNAEETVSLAKKAAKATVIATHLEAIDHCPVTREKMKQIAKQQNVNILVPEDGEVLNLNN